MGTGSECVTGTLTPNTRSRSAFRHERLGRRSFYLSDLRRRCAQRAGQPRVSNDGDTIRPTCFPRTRRPPTPQVTGESETRVANFLHRPCGILRFYRLSRKCYSPQSTGVEKPPSITPSGFCKGGPTATSNCMEDQGRHDKPPFREIDHLAVQTGHRSSRATQRPSEDRRRGGILRTQFGIVNHPRSV